MSLELHIVQLQVQCQYQAYLQYIVAAESMRIFFEKAHPCVSLGSLGNLFWSGSYPHDYRLGNRSSLGYCNLSRFLVNHEQERR